MRSIVNVFPFLKEQETKEDEATSADPALVSERLAWLLKADAASQEDFALHLIRQEPKGSAFHATWATILTMKQSIIERVLKLEIGACAKKIDANHAHIKKLYAHYAIAISPNRGMSNFDFKFPHQSVWSTAGEGNQSVKLAQSGFPLAAIRGQYDHLHVPPSAIEAVENVLLLTKKRRKLNK